MEYLKIKNWAKWQSYRSDRGQPPWIKIHRRVMRNPEWVSLSDSERGQLVSIWLLAADHNGVIPASPVVIQKLCFLTTPPDLNKFTDLGFIEDTCRQSDAISTPNGSQDVTPKADKNREDKKKKESESDSEPEIHPIPPAGGAAENTSADFSEIKTMPKDEVQKLPDQEKTKPDSNHFEDKIEDKKILDQIQELCSKIASLKPDKFNPYEAVQFSANQNYNPLAIVVCLKAMSNSWDKIEKKWAWFKRVVKNESMNANERFEISKHHTLMQSLKSIKIPDFLQTLPDLPPKKDEAARIEELRKQAKLATQGA